LGNDKMLFLKCRSNICVLGFIAVLAGCASEPRAVLLPLQYPDGTPVQTTDGDAVMAGYQTYGSNLHANATALYESAQPTSCMTCAHVTAIVSEPSVLRQATGILGASTVGAGAVMSGVGTMNYGSAALDGKLQDNVVQNVEQRSSAHSYAASSSNAYSNSMSYQPYGPSYRYRK
jgi:hypothetical protein